MQLLTNHLFSSIKFFLIKVWCLCWGYLYLLPSKAKQNKTATTDTSFCTRHERAKAKSKAFKPEQREHKDQAIFRRQRTRDTIKIRKPKYPDHYEVAIASAEYFYTHPYKFPPKYLLSVGSAANNQQTTSRNRTVHRQHFICRADSRLVRRNWLFTNNLW